MKCNQSLALNVICPVVIDLKSIMEIEFSIMLVVLLQFLHMVLLLLECVEFIELVSGLKSRHSCLVILMF